MNSSIEIWKPVVGFEGSYEVSSIGRVRSFHFGKRILSKRLSRMGYFVVNLWKNNSSKTLFIHRLVAQAFIPNPKNLPQVNHKDEVKTNNNVCNLEWCDASYNLSYGNRTSSMRKRVAQYTKDGILVSTYESIAEASKANGIKSDGSISDCCNHSDKHHSVYGYVWKFI